ncbi:MAG TPA: glutamate--tRNA ligase [Chloroflexota bacterium]|nr:glutamate--tRNA ligase [Chloroflexota bacterium]
MTPDTPAVRVRIAPGPTGPFHRGRSRTALINWLFARHHGGKFILRIEDTDRERSRPEHLQSILDGLRWLGLDWDEGPEVGGPFEPYFQMGRLDTYRAYAERLEQSGHVYRCYCSPDELAELRRAADREHRPFRYPRTCRFLTDQERADRESRGLSWVLRLKVPESGTTSWNDMVLGPITIENGDLDDLIVVRSDGLPTYNFAVVVDDSTMRITHVIRGQDHVSNTPRQLLIYRFLGDEPPQFGHLPLVVNLDESKMSGREGAEPVMMLGRDGYLPDAVVNYLATVGVTYGEGEEVLSREELIRQFEISRVGKSRTKFDQEKLDWFNGVYIRKLPLDDFVRKALPYLELRGLVSTPPTPEEIDYASRTLGLEQERVRTLAETPEAVEFFFVAQPVYDPELLVQRKSTREESRRVLEAAIDTIRGIDAFTHATLEPRFRGLAEELGLKTGVVFGTLRVAITGRTAAPPLFDTMEALGRERVLRRLEAASLAVEAIRPG